MKKFLYVSLTFLSSSLYSGLGSITASGVIDPEYQFSLHYDLNYKHGLVKFATFKNNVCVKAEDCQITAAEIVDNNDYILKTDKGNFFIPAYKSGKIPTFNQRPIEMVRAEDLIAMSMQVDRMQENDRKK